jgi:FkbM family methyltransferase
LQSADASLGPGPFVVRFPTCRLPFVVRSNLAISSIRELYVRDCYLRGGVLAIGDGSTVVDLGANTGNFTKLALAHGNSVRVIAVEPSKILNEAFMASLSLNHGFSERTKLIRAFLGAYANKILETNQNYHDAPWISEDELIQMAGIDRVDFLKCDIEGGEFDLLGRNSKLLKLTKAIAIEIHAFAGDVDKFVAVLRDVGFHVLNRTNGPDGSCILLASRT